MDRPSTQAMAGEEAEVAGEDGRHRRQDHQRGGFLQVAREMGVDLLEAADGRAVGEVFGVLPAPG
ncbi:hypothetical protein, partial [Streptomyces sp. NPDC127084]|uniref:hypothetical protein n=1 Tax=Streptomyces sp. NPDC127084 TaxID=3347133 RepID=UPI003651254F